MRNQDIFLEQALLDEGHLTGDGVDRARAYSREHGVDFVDALIATDVVDARTIALAKANVCEVPYVHIEDFEPSYANAQLVPHALAERYCLFPLFAIDGVLTLAMDDPLNLDALDQIRQVAKCDIDTVISDRESIRMLVSRVYSLSSDSVRPIKSTDDSFDDDDDVDIERQPVVAAVNQIIADAVEQEASDVHINPDEGQLHLRYRIDGVLQSKQGPSLSMHPALVQRLKVMANLDLTQTRRPQDGKFRFTHQGKQVEIRMSTIPTVCGENVVLRILASAQRIDSFESLGVPTGIIDTLNEIISRPYGIFLVTGPTGSGKTTTLYTALNRINDPTRNIMTIEDPVEIRLPYVRQVQVHKEINLTFASALRSILRQDPDVVLLGEIRDEETATIALQAALTGHLVLSTLHTNDAPGGVARLRDFGLPSFVINSAVLGIIAQRLVRRVCEHCKQPDAPDDLMRNRFQLEEHTDGFVIGRGCSRCSQTGYRGRVGLYELLHFDDVVKQQVEAGASTAAIRTTAIASGMRVMWQDGLEKARLGLTTLEEINKAVAVSAAADRQADARIAA